MKRKLIFLLLLIPFIATHAQQFTGSLLWEISGNGLTKSSYIMGTHHLAPLSILDSRPQVMQKLNESEQVVGEVMMDDMSDLQQKITQIMLLPDSISYQDLLTGTEFHELDSLLINHMGTGLAQIGRIKPAMISMIYMISIHSKITGSDMSKHVALDILFQQTGAAQNKQTVALETVNDQVYALFEATSLKEQAESLLCTLKNENSSIDVTDKLMQFYINEDLDALDKLFNDSSIPCQASEEAAKILNKNRNDKWLEKLPQLMTTNSNFIAVGCLHLAGEDGLLYQLHKMGYTVTAVR